MKEEKKTSHTTHRICCIFFLFVSMFSHTYDRSYAIESTGRVVCASDRFEMRFPTEKSCSFCLFTNVECVSRAFVYV